MIATIAQRMSDRPTDRAPAPLSDVETSGSRGAERGWEPAVTGALLFLAGAVVSPLALGWSRAEHVPSWLLLLALSVTGGFGLYRFLAARARARTQGRSPLRPADRARLAYQRGLEYGRQGRLTEALASHREALRLDPGLSEAWAALGLIYEQQGSLTQSLLAYREVVRLQPNHCGAWFKLGVLYRKQGQHEQAIAAYREALRIEPALPEAWYGLGIAFTRQGQRTEALTAYRTAVRLKPDLAPAWLGLADLHEHFGDDAEAIAAYLAALRWRPSFAAAHARLASLYREGGRLTDAVKAYLEALRLKPHDRDVWYGLGITYAKQGNREGVLEVYQQLAILDSRLAEEFSRQYIEPPVSAVAGEHLLGGLDAGPTDPPGARGGGASSLAEAWYELALSYRKAQRQEEALSALREAVRFDPEHEKAWTDLGTIHRRRGEHTEAIKAFREAARVNPRNAVVWQSLGLIYGEQGQAAKALKAFRRAIHFRPRSVHAWWGLGMAYAMQRDRVGSMQVYRQLRALDSAAAEGFAERYLGQWTEQTAEIPPPSPGSGSPDVETAAGIQPATPTVPPPDRGMDSETLDSLEATREASAGFEYWLAALRRASFRRHRS